MAGNFRITQHWKGSVLHLKLSGNFDGTSAMELVRAIAENIESAREICIETDGLGDLLPFGLDVFQKKFTLFTTSSQRLIFTGNPALQLVSEGVRFMQSCPY